MLKKYRVLHIIELVMIIASLALFLVPKAHYTFNADAFEYENGVYLESLFDVAQPGIYVDNSMTEGECEILTPVADLHPGSYMVYLRYLNSDNNNTFSALSDYNTNSVRDRRIDVSLGLNENPSYAKELFLNTWQKVEGYRISFKYTGNGYLYAYGLDIVETNWWKLEVLLIVVLLSLLVDIVLYLRDTKDEKELFTYFYAFMLAIITSMLSLSPYLLPGHDSAYHLGRMEALAHAIMQGNLPLRVSDYWLDGLGYASSVFYCDFFLTPAALLSCAGASLQGAWKVYHVCINLATAFVGLYCFKKIIKSRVGVLTALTLYMLSVYRLSCMYIRFAAGDYTAQIFLPLVLYGLIRIYNDCEGSETLIESFKKALPFIIGVSGLVLSHVMSTLIVAMFVAVFVIVNFKKTFKKNTIVRLLCSLVVVLAMNSWFIFPFMELFGHLRLTNESMRLGRFRASGTYLWQLFDMFPYGTGDSYPAFESLGNNFRTEMPYTAAPAAIGVFIYLALRISKIIKREGESERAVRLADKIMVGSLVGMYMTTIYFPWDFIEQLSPVFEQITQAIQCPWRFLTVSVTLASILCGLLYEFMLQDKERLARFAGLFAAVMIALGGISAGYFMTTRGDNGNWTFHYDSEDFRGASVMGGEYLPRGISDESYDYTEPVPGEGVTVSDWSRETGAINVTVTNSSTAVSYVDVPYLYYKGYRAKSATGTVLLADSNDVAITRVTLPSGFEGTIKVYYQEPGYWRFYEIVSILVFIGLVVFGVLDYRALRKKA